jgi:hypothetical protein
LMVFRGYDVFYESDPVTINYTATGAETLNTGAYNYGITITDPLPNPTEIPPHLGWNLAGNPYPSPVDWLASSGWDKSDINDAKYIWDGNLDLYTIFIGGGSPIGINGGTRFIPSNQGFWVQAVVNGSIGISNAVRVGDITGTPDFYKLQPPDYPLLSLVASGNDKSDEVVIRFIEGTTGGFDLNYDATKLYSFAEDVPQLGIRNGKQVLALNTLPYIYEDLCLVINFQCGKAGIYEIGISERTTLEPGTRIYLQDLFSNLLVKLSKDQNYSFYHDLSDEKTRFKLYFNPSEETLNGCANGEFFNAYSSRNNIHITKITSEDLNGEIEIFNVTGQKVHGQALENGQTTDICLNVPTGYYLLYIVTNQYVYNKKILIIN